MALPAGCINITRSPCSTTDKRPAITRFPGEALKRSTYAPPRPGPPKRALLLLAWLQIKLIERRLPSGAGSAEILMEIERVSTDLKAQALAVLYERERARR